MLNLLTQNKKFLISLFCLSIFFRVIFFTLFLNKNNFTYDTPTYHNVAVRIADGRGITNLDGSLHFYRVPGYSLFLAFCYKLFGKNIKKALLIQLLFASFIPIFVFFLFLILFSYNFFLVIFVLIFTIFHLCFFLFSGFAMTESFFTFFFLLFLLLFFYNNFFLAGFFLGICSLFRPVGHYLLVVALFVLLIFGLKFSDKIKGIFVLFVGWFLIVFPWILRNFLLTGFIFFHTLPGIHFLKHSAARLASEIYRSSYMQGLRKVTIELEVLKVEQEKKLKRRVNEIEFCILAEKVSFKYLKKNIFLTLKHFMINILKTGFSLYSAELLYLDSEGKLPDYNQNRGIKDWLMRFFVPRVSNKLLIPIIYFEIFFLLFIWLGFAFFAINSFFIKSDFYLLIRILPFMALFIFVSLSCGFARLRLPIEPFLIILSFKFWIEFFRREKRILWKQN